MQGTSGMHRRKTSKDLEEEEKILIMPTLDPSRPPPILVPPPPGNHPQQDHTRTPPSFVTFPTRSPGLTPIASSAGPFRTSFSGIPIGRPANGMPTSASPFKTTFGHRHTRTRSISGPFAPPQPSPLSTTFPMASDPPSSFSPPSLNVFPPPPQLTTSQSLPSENAPSVSLNDPPATSPKTSRRHSRLHSRNLSIFFPRPGSLPTSTISEDGAQELELRNDIEAPVSIIPSAGSSIQFPRSESLVNGHAPPTPLGVGFTFGGKTNPSLSSPTPPAMTSPQGTTSSRSIAKSRRGHHHKHSMSHSFFSFLEPGANGPPPSSTSHPNPDQLHTQPTPTPVSPWKSTPSSPPILHSSYEQHDEGAEGGIPLGATVVASAQFFVGAWLWVCGQRIGSLSCTGIGYWVVFDAFGVWVNNVLPGWLNMKKNGLMNARGAERGALRRPYGNKRVITVFMFAQAVYLMFASVYICKETIEHVLLTAGEGHHHHPGEDDNWIGIEFPPLMTLLTFFSIINTALLYNNHAKLIDVTGNRIPTLSALIRSLSQPSKIRHNYDSPPNDTLSILFSNPYIASPLLSCLAMFIIAVFLPPTQHRPADLLLAAVIAVVTFKVSYQACVVLGTVLLQTAPRRGLPSGKMEAFLRVMREVERHPNIVHLPAPHFWQLTPTRVNHQAVKDRIGTGKQAGGAVVVVGGGEDTLIVTVQLHVREDLGDDEVLNLTKWTWERCVRALGSSSLNGTGTRGGGDGAIGGVEVTVGVVRG